MKARDSLSRVLTEQFSDEVLFLQRLIQTNSVNSFIPETSPPDVPVEKDVALLIEGELTRLGFQPQLHGVSPQRPNVLCHFSGGAPGEKTLILTTHMDTVKHQAPLLAIPGELLLKMAASTESVPQMQRHKLPLLSMLWLLSKMLRFTFLEMYISLLWLTRSQVPVLLMAHATF